MRIGSGDVVVGLAMVFFCTRVRGDVPPSRSDTGFSPLSANNPIAADLSELSFGRGLRFGALTLNFSLGLTARPMKFVMPPPLDLAFFSVTFLADAFLTLATGFFAPVFTREDEVEDFFVRLFDALGDLDLILAGE